MRKIFCGIAEIFSKILKIIAKIFYFLKYKKTLFIWLKHHLLPSLMFDNSLLVLYIFT